MHHLLADQIRLPRLGNPDRAGDDRDRDHAADQHCEPGRVEVRALGQHVVEQVSQQERRDHADPGRDDDQCQQRREPPPVGAKQRHDAATLAGGRGQRGIHHRYAVPVIARARISRRAR